MESYNNYDIIINMNTLKEDIKIETSEEGMINYNNKKMII